MELTFAALTAHFGSEQSANRFVHISEADRYVYFVNPKVACSSIKATLNTREAALAGRPLEYRSMKDIHNRSRNPLMTPRLMGYEKFDGFVTGPAVTRFTFTRDPVRRFCSAYLSKLGPNRLQQPIRKRLMAYLGREETAPLDIAAFARLCANDATARDMDPHWRLQRSQIGYDLVPFDFIGRHEHFAADFATLSRYLFDGEELEVLDTRRMFNRSTTSEILTAEISPELRRTILSAYAADVDMLAEIDARRLFRLPGDR